MGQPGLAGSQFPSEDEQQRKLRDLERAVQQFTAANILATAGIGVEPNGILVNGSMQFRREDGTIGVSVDPTDGTFVAYDSTGAAPVARFGALQETGPGYGVEVLVGSTWVQLGAQTTTWASVSGKPATFPPSAHTHDGSDIVTGTVPQADGSQYGWTNNVGGTSFYQVWVGNDGGFHFGRNVSSIRYKENVRAHSVDPQKVLQIRPVLYDRIDGGTDEYGLIAEQVAEHMPELLVWFEGKIDGLRYELLTVAHQDVLIDHENRIRALEGREPLPAPATKPNVPSSGAPDVAPDPLPYTIQE